MKLYVIKYTLVDETAGADGGTLSTEHQEFATSDGAASKRSTAIKAQFKDQLDGKVEREAFDMPTKKDSLVEWLNTHATVVSAEIVK